MTTYKVIFSEYILVEAESVEEAYHKASDIASEMNVSEVSSICVEVED